MGGSNPLEQLRDAVQDTFMGGTKDTVASIGNVSSRVASTTANAAVEAKKEEVKKEEEVKKDDADKERMAAGTRARTLLTGPRGLEDESGGLMKASARKMLKAR